MFAVLARLSATVALIALFAVPASASAAQPIADARALPLGTTVTVEGTATTPSGAFESSFYDKGFALQDRSAGIYVKTASDLGVRPGRRARVTGVLTDSSGLLTIVPSANGVALGRWGAPVLPEPVRTAAVGESTEGRLVQAIAKITKPVENDLPYGHKVYVDDGSGEVVVFVNTRTGIGVGRLAVGDWVRVVGFSSQYSDHYEIDPRFSRDVGVVGGF
ncbi:single stranded DNA-binding domain-containing protein [Allokutzneria albata]|uniref:Nucleotide-binding protein n=1 Tax=Allokutzneria albata TaxID=211114 RepID=A0A1G9T140_ALLAB|nr:hypothetical protein [Allokutzneria albata]SDM41434.1 hypothetical protein SAMN04489726_1501 [Allokutzneria albata]